MNLSGGNRVEYSHFLHVEMSWDAALVPVKHKAPQLMMNLAADPNATIAANITDVSTSEVTVLDSKIWKVFLYYAVFVWISLFGLYWVGNYFVSHFMIVNIGSDATAYQRVSQSENEDGSESATEALRTSATGGKRLFPSDEDLQYWDVEMTKIPPKKPSRESDPSTYEYGLDDDEDDVLL